MLSRLAVRAFDAGAVLTTTLLPGASARAAELVVSHDGVDAAGCVDPM